MALTVPYISPSVYEKGVANTITGDSCYLAVVLLDSDNKILATSAIFNAGGSTTAASTADGANYYKAASSGNGFTFSGKILTTPTIPYTSTRSVTDSNKQASNFAVLYIKSDDTVNKAEAYDGSGYFNYPNFAKDDEISTDTPYGNSRHLLIAGSLSGNPIVNTDSNFRLTSTTITFTETTVN